ncbi:PPE domain-containing protein, partial [Actinophytocola sediminis]
MNDWLSSADNHASRDYDRDRRRETWHEAHPRSERAQRRADKRGRERARNRSARRFGKINWDAYQHEQLYDMIMRANPVTMYARAGQWQALAGRIEGTTGRVQQVVERLMTSWQGQAAVDAAAANTRLMHWAGTASHTAGRIAEGLANYTEAVETARRRMPDPAFASAERNFRDGYTVTLTGGPSDAVFLRELLTDGLVSHERARARKAEAVAVMESYEAHSRQVHDQIPHFTDAHTGIEPGESWTPGPDAPYAAPPPSDQPPADHPPASPPPPADTPVPAATVPGTTAAAGFADPNLPAG